MRRPAASFNTNIFTTEPHWAGNWGSGPWIERLRSSTLDGYLPWTGRLGRGGLATLADLDAGGQPRHRCAQPRPLTVPTELLKRAIPLGATGHWCLPGD